MPDEPISLCYPPIDDVIRTLHCQRPSACFPSMLQPLHDAGVKCLNDVTARNESDLVAWTGLAPALVLVLYYCATVEIAKWDGLMKFDDTRKLERGDDTEDENSKAEGSVEDVAVHRA